jgi:Arc/MetJ-type ribon-helix-helix transcriptional regulator
MTIGSVNGMSPVNVKLDEHEVLGLDAAVLEGRALNRSDAIRIALKQQLRIWEQERWDDAWNAVVPDPSGEFDEFDELNTRARKGWDDMENAQ